MPRAPSPQAVTIEKISRHCHMSVPSSELLWKRTKWQVLLPELHLASGWSHKGRSFSSAGMTWPTFVSLTSPHSSFSPSGPLLLSPDALLLPKHSSVSPAKGWFPQPTTLLSKLFSLITPFSSLKSFPVQSPSEVLPDHLSLKLIYISIFPENASPCNTQNVYCLCLRFISWSTPAPPPGTQGTNL